MKPSTLVPTKTDTIMAYSSALRPKSTVRSNRAQLVKSCGRGPSCFQSVICKLLKAHVGGSRRDVLPVGAILFGFIVEISKLQKTLNAVAPGAGIQPIRIERRI